MRLFLACAAITFAACSNAPPSPPPTVTAPTVACTLPVDAGPACSPFGASDADIDANAATSGTCDAGAPTYAYDECQFPPSVCADSHWAAYFDNGTCVQGECELVTKYHYCDTGCSGGACISHGPTLAGRGF